MAFDLEVARLAPPEELPGVTCAAIATDNGKAWTWAGCARDGIAAEMSPLEVAQMVRTLIYWSRDYRLVTWNGLGYDLQVLYHAARTDGLRNELRSLARFHCDPAFQCLCQMGFMLGLETVAKALGVGGKMEGMRGDLEPYLWGGLSFPSCRATMSPEEAAVWDERVQAVAALEAEHGIVAGSQEARRLCLAYVEQDARATLDVYRGLCKVGAEGLSWTTKKGTRSVKAWDVAKVNGEPLIVEQAMMLAEPDVSWMKGGPAITRAGCTGWLGNPNTGTGR